LTQTIEVELEKGKDLLLDADYEPALEVARKIEGVTRVYIAPESMEQLEQQLTERGDTAATIQVRLDKAKSILQSKHYLEYDYLLINEANRIEKTVSELYSIVKIGRLKPAKRFGRMSTLVDAMMAESTAAQIEVTGRQPGIATMG
jgi:guanylate kinase